MLEMLKKEADRTYTENGAVTHAGTGSGCLDFFAAAGALRSAEEAEIVRRFIRSYAEDADLAMKTLFFARDIRGGLGERRVFRVILRWLADHEPASCRKNIPLIGEYGRYDDLLCLFGTACEADMLAYIGKQVREDLRSGGEGQPVSLLGKWLPSVNASSADTVFMAKRIARYLGMNDAQYRKTLTALRKRIRILENRLREKDYTFEYEAQPSGALFKYRRAFLRNDGERYQAFLELAKAKPSAMHTGTLAPYDIIRPVVERRCIREEERASLDVTWNAQEDFTGSENALAVVDGSGSMYWGGSPLPAAVAQSLGIYFAERNTGAFHNHFITFSASPKLVEIRGRDIVEKVRYCMQFDECSNTDLEKVFGLILRTAVKNRLPQEELPAKLYIISDMEFDCCSNAGATNFEHAKAAFEKAGYRLPEVIFWNVQSRNAQQPVTKNEQGVALVSGCSPQIFAMLKDNLLNPYRFMMQVLASERYRPVAA